jgi:hypothetical protein
MSEQQEVRIRKKEKKLPVLDKNLEISLYIF